MTWQAISTALDHGDPYPAPLEPIFESLRRAGLDERELAAAVGWHLGLLDTSIYETDGLDYCILPIPRLC